MTRFVHPARPARPVTAASGPRRWGAVVAAVCTATALLLLLPAPAGAAVDPEPWHAREQVLADDSTGPALPHGELLDVQRLAGPTQLAVATSKGLYRVTAPGSGRRHDVSTVARVEDAAGSPANWQARLHDDGRVVAFVCDSTAPDNCLLRVRGTDGTWTTVAGGGSRWVEPSAEPGLPGWTHGRLPRTSDYAGVDPLTLSMTLPVTVLLDSKTDRVYFDQRGFAKSLWSFDLRTGAFARVGLPDYDTDPRGLGIDFNLFSLTLLPGGRLLVAPDVMDAQQRVVDLVSDETTLTALPVGQTAVAADGTVWVWTARYRLDGTLIEMLDGEDGLRAGLGSGRATFDIAAGDDGVLTYGTSSYPIPGDWRWRDVGPRLRLHQTGRPGVADAPATVSAVAGDERATVTWSVAYGYGRPVTGHTVTVSPGGRRVAVAATARSATITGLPNDTAYRFTVSATNEVGPGPVSAASAPVTPRYTVTPGLTYRPVAHLRQGASASQAGVVARTLGGRPTDQQLLCDWDGNGTDTLGLYRPGTGQWFTSNSTTSTANTTSLTYGTGASYLRAFCGDWDGNGTDTPGLYDTRTATWSLRNANSTGGAAVAFRYGTPGAGDLPLVGDWDGNDTDTPGLYRTSSSTWHLRNVSSAGAAQASFRYGTLGAGDVPLAGDWDADGTDTVGIRRTSNAYWYLRNRNNSGVADYTFSFGRASDKPLVGDWDGDGVDEPALSRLVY